MNWSSSWNVNNEVKVDVVGYEPVTLTIPYDGGLNIKTVQAKQVGDLAVVNFDEGWDWWLIVHVPTLTINNLS